MHPLKMCRYHIYNVTPSRDIKNCIQVHAELLRKNLIIEHVLISIELYNRIVI